MLLWRVEESTSEDKHIGFHLEKGVQRCKHSRPGIYAKAGPRNTHTHTHTHRHTHKKQKTYICLVHTVFFQCTQKTTHINTKRKHIHSNSKLIHYSYIHAFFIHTAMMNILLGDKRGFALLLQLDDVILWHNTGQMNTTYWQKHSQHACMYRMCDCTLFRTLTSICM